MAPHLLRCQGIAVGNYSFTLGRLEAGPPSTLAQLGLNNVISIEIFGRNVNRKIVSKIQLNYGGLQKCIFVGILQCLIY
jgi:hypothetical protein